MERIRGLWRRHGTWVGLAVTGLLALFCYGFVLHLPFFRDDLPIMSWLSGHGWAEIWTRSSENQFYRPLAFTIYKLGRLLPSGVDRVVLHGVSLLIHWVSAGLITRLIKLRGRPDGEAFLGSILFVVFPFTFMAIPWVTAMSHPLVTMLTLVAVVAALEAGEDDAPQWWGVSLVATALAPMAHESGYVCAVIVAGIVAIEQGLGGGRRRLALALGVAINLAAVIWRGYVPGTGETSLAGLQDLFGNTMFSFHGLVYPVGPLIGTLVRGFGIQDFLLVTVATIGLSVLGLGLTLRLRDGRWAASGLWWWALGMVPAVASLRYSYNYTSPRVHALASPGIVMLWAGLIVSLSSLSTKAWIRLGASFVLGGTIITQNVAFLRRQGRLSEMLGTVYGRVLDVAADATELDPGFVNLPASLAYPERTYALILETVLFVPYYSDLSEFLAVNGVPQAEAAVYAPVVRDSDYVCALSGDGVDWEEMRQFAVDHETVWLARWHHGRIVLDHVGGIQAAETRSLDEPLITFEDGVAIESASVTRNSYGRWKVAVDWMVEGQVDGQIFAHVVDGDGNLLMQADGPALGGMVPPWIWRSGDRIHDVRYVGADGASPLTLQVGLFNADGRRPAYANGVRCPNDACSVATWYP